MKMNTMTRTMAAMCMAAACGVAAVAAQSTTAMDQTTMKGHDTMAKNGSVMVTGCVGAKDANGHYMLNNALKTDGMAGKTDSMVGTTGATATAETMSYALSGGDLKAHVGHKVEVTGMLDAGRMDKMKDSSKMKDDGMKDDKAMSPMLKVKSVKMISDSCQ